MKKLLTMLALAGITSVAMAQTSASVDLQNQSFANGSPDQQQITLNVKRQITPLLAVDGGVQVSQNESSTDSAKSYKVGGRYEAGITASKALFTSPFDAYGRLGIGSKVSSGAEAVSYHSQEIGVVYHTPVQGLHAKVGYRWRDTFADGKGDTAETTRFALTYDLNKNNSIVLRRDNNRATSANGGDTTVNAIQYVAKF
jgi:hypothetical protein